MTALHQIAKPAALFLVLASMTCVSGSARAETGWLWFDSAFATPTHHYVQRARPARVSSVAKPILVSAVAPQPRSDCFWCNRPVYVSGLSF
jgi:hypothetical protein